MSTVVEPPIIISLVAADPLGRDSIYENGDTITVTFNVDTDRAGLAVGTVQARSVVDQLFSFTQALGAGYQGVWSTSRTFVITVGS